MESLTSSFSNYLMILIILDGIPRETVILCLFTIFNIYLRILALINTGYSIYLKETIGAMNYT